MTSILPEAEPVVLAGNVAPAAVDVGARDVLPSIAVLHFRCLGSRSESEQLVARGIGRASRDSSFGVCGVRRM